MLLFFIYIPLQGTEMRQRPLHDTRTSTPALLKSALEDPYLLQYYVLDGDIVDMALELAYKMPDRDQNGKQKLTAVGGRRRIDYIIHRRSENLVSNDCHVSISLQVIISTS